MKVLKPIPLILKGGYIALSSVVLELMGLRLLKPVIGAKKYTRFIRTDKTPLNFAHSHVTEKKS